jgi:hypothetical protein
LWTEVPGLEEVDLSGRKRKELERRWATPDIVPVPEEVGTVGMAPTVRMDDGDDG